MTPLPKEIMDIQEWKQIKGYEGLYMISDHGKVWSIKANKMLKPALNGYPRKEYLVVGLSKNGKSKTVRIHRLVAEHFVPNPHNKPDVNHEDGDKSNNRSTNLSWVTKSENVRHAFKNGLNKVTREQLQNMFKKSSAALSTPCVQYDLKGNKLAEFHCMKSASIATGIAHSNISNHINGKITKPRKFIWKKA